MTLLVFVVVACVPALPELSPQEMVRRLDAATNAAATSTVSAAETRDALSWSMTATVAVARAEAEVAAVNLASSQVAEVATIAAAQTQTATAIVPITATWQARSAEATNVKLANLIQDEQEGQRRLNEFFDAINDTANTILFAFAGMVAIALFGFGLHRFIVQLTPSVPPAIVAARRALAEPLDRLKVIDGQVEEIPVDEDAEADRAWRLFVADVGRAAAIVGSWSVNALSTRAGGAAVAGEDAVEQARNIAAELGALADYRGRRGYDWSRGWGLAELGRALEAGREFTLPRRDDGALILPPRADLSHCNATQRNKKRSGAGAGAKPERNNHAQ